MKKSMLRIFALTAVLGMTLAACGSGGSSAEEGQSSSTESASPSSESSDAGSTAAEPTQEAESTEEAETPASSEGESSGGAADGEPIVIGMISSLSGPYSTLGGFDQKTVELLMNQLNDAGGIDGRPVKVVYEDDQTSPTQAVVALDKIAAENPVAIIGPVLSSACTAIVDKVDQLQIPMVTLCATDSQVEPVHPFDFMATLSTDAMTGAVGQYLKAEGKADVGVLYDSGDFGQSGLNWIQEHGDVNIISSEAYNLSATTFLPQLQTLLAKNPQAVIAWGAGAPLVTIAKEFKQLGADIPLVFSGAAATPLFVGPAAESGDGVVMASSMANVFEAAPDSNPSKAIVAKLAADYQAEYDESMSQFTADACTAWRIIVNGIEKAGSTDPVAVRDAIEANPTVACHGTYTYSPTDHRGLDASQVWVVQDQNGTLTPTQFSIDQHK